MGEHKLPKTPQAAVRPGMSIIRLKAAVQVFQTSRGQEIDADTLDYMADLGAVMDWIDHLETTAGRASREAAANRALGLSVPEGEA
jgi:hypothetical protein